MYEVRHGDCLEVLKSIEDNSIDAIVTDPPYGLNFMGKKWDYDVPGVEVWAECLRVLKPGGHLLAFAGTRTQHRMAVRIEDAGFEIRDMIAWVYGSGFPKSLDVSKAIDKAAGAEREVVGSKIGQPGYSLKANDTDEHNRGAYGKFTDAEAECAITAPATEAAKQWQGWGTALKPALEPITVARKPLQGTVAENVLRFGTGALNIDGCRVALTGEADAAQFENNHRVTERLPSHYDGQPLGLHDGGWKQRVGAANIPPGRWPANLIHDGSEEVVALFPQSEVSGSAKNGTRSEATPEGMFGKLAQGRLHNDTGSAARFFYCAKASKKDRGEGNNHPTVKPTALMRYLVRLATPPGGTVMDIFTGSGSTGKAAVLEGFRFVGIEREAEYVAIARARIDAAVAKIAEELAG